MKPASSKAKGRKLQQWVRDLLLSLAKDLEPDDIRSTSMGAAGEDILFSPKARKVYPFSIECKSRAKLSVQDFYEQAKTNCPKGSEPIVVLKQNMKKPLVLVDAEYFFDHWYN